MGSNTLQR